MRLGARGGSFIHSAGKLRRENCDWQKVYTGVICSAGSFALLLRFLLNTHRLVAFRSYYPPWGHSGQQTEPCRFLGYSASRPHFLLSLCPAARLLSIFDRFHFIFFPSVFFFFFLPVFSQLFIPINLFCFHHLFFFPLTFLLFLLVFFSHIRGTQQAWLGELPQKGMFRGKKVIRSRLYTLSSLEKVWTQWSFPSSKGRILTNISI